jgi:hypothetical protein
MITKGFILASCAGFVFSGGVALAGPCNTGQAANLKDAGSGPTVGSTAPNARAGTRTDQHPPTGTMNRASGDTATSSQDAQKQMQGQPTAAQQAEGAKTTDRAADKTTGQMADEGC